MTFSMSGRAAAAVKRFVLPGPLVVAPLGGGPTTPELVSASCNAGALGSLAGAYLTPGQLRDSIRKTKELTSRPFAVNLFAPAPDVSSLSRDQVRRALQDTHVFRQEMGLADPPLAPPFHELFDQQFQVVMEEKPAAFSFVFGLLDDRYLRECEQRDIFTIGAATTLEEALLQQESGVNAVVAQGTEAGGHRAMFYSEQEDPGLGTLTLTELVARHLRIPIIASGGLMSGGDIAKVLSVGATAAQLGTAFLLANEAATSPAYRQALCSAQTPPTKLTRVFSGRIARGLENRFMREMEARHTTILPFPAQNALTRDIRAAAAKASQAEYLSLWAGTGVSKITTGSTAEIVARLMRELDLALLKEGRAK